MTRGFMELDEQPPIPEPTWRCLLGGTLDALWSPLGLATLLGLAMLAAGLALL